MRASVLCLLSLLLASSPVALAQTPASLEQFTKHDEFGGIKLSPNGDYAAYLTGDFGRTFIVFVSVKDKKRLGGVRCQPGFLISDFVWVSNTRVVYRLAEQIPGVAQPALTGEIFAVDYDGKNEDFIYGFRAQQQQTGTLTRVRQGTYGIASLISPLYSDDKHVLISERQWANQDSVKPQIYLLDVFTGKKKFVDFVPLFDAIVIPDRSERARFAVGQNDQFNLAVSWKPDPNGKWTAFELPGFQRDSVMPRFFSEDNQSVYFTGAKLDERQTALYELNLKTKEANKIYAFDRGDVSDIIVDLADKKIVGISSNVDKPVIHWLDKDDKSARIYSALSRAFPDQNVDLVSSTRDGRLTIARVSSDTNPGEYYLFDTQAMKADYLQATRRWIDRKAMRPKEPFAMRARDGLELQGYVTKPAGDGPYPLVVLVHGGPHSIRDFWSFEWDVQLLASRGFAVLQVNYRGSGGFGDEFERLGYRQWGASMQDDVTDATRWAIDKKIAHPNRICIFGASYGGYAALQGAVREPKLYRCAIGMAGIYDLELMFTSADIPESRGGLAYLEKVLGNDHAQLRSRSPALNADKIEAPVLLIHGKEDWRADYEQARRMKAALEKSGKQFDWLSLSREGHGVFDAETRREVYDRVLAFLNKNLDMNPASASAAQLP